MVAKTLTTADAVITLSAPPVFVGPQTMQGFAADDLFDAPPNTNAEYVMGLDGILSTAFVFNGFEWTLTLQANSLSKAFFDTLNGFERANKQKIPLSGTITLKAIEQRISLINGYVRTYASTPSAGRILQPLKYGFIWQDMQPSPTG